MDGDVDLDDVDLDDVDLDDVDLNLDLNAEDEDLDEDLDVDLELNHISVFVSRVKEQWQLFHWGDIPLI